MRNYEAIQNPGEKLVTINIFTTDSPSRHKYTLFINKRSVENYFHNKQRPSDKLL